MRALDIIAELKFLFACYTEIIGHVEVDFVASKEEERLRLWAVDLKVCPTASLSSFQLFDFLAAGQFDPAAGVYWVPAMPEMPNSNSARQSMSPVETPDQAMLGMLGMSHQAEARSVSSFGGSDVSFRSPSAWSHVEHRSINQTPHHDVSGSQIPALQASTQQGSDARALHRPSTGIASPGAAHGVSHMS